MLTNLSITNVFKAVKTVPFHEIFTKFHGGEVRRRGRFFVALCPFHSEKVASFTIYDSFFRCYGCGEAGDAVHFVGKLHNVRPLDAAQLIAERFGLPVQSGPLSREELAKLARAQAEELREKRLRQAFCDWCREAGKRARLLSEAIRLLMAERGLDICDDLIPLVHELPQLEHWADTLTGGGEEEKIAIYRNTEARRWLG